MLHHLFPETDAIPPTRTFHWVDLPYKWHLTESELETGCFVKNHRELRSHVRAEAESFGVGYHVDDDCCIDLNGYPVVRFHTFSNLPALLDLRNTWVAAMGAQAKGRFPVIHSENAPDSCESAEMIPWLYAAGDLA